MQIANLAQLLRQSSLRPAPPLLDARFGAGGWQYVGWGNLGLALPDSVLANPYTCSTQHRAARIPVATRAEAVARYRAWLWEQLRAGDPAVLRALTELRDDQVLVCWCAPRACHAEVIIRAAQWLRCQAARGAGQAGKM